MQYVKLNNGIEMPQVGLGTFLIPKDKLEDTLIKAYDMGYRQFDTAWRYYNEADIARIFKKHGIKREDVFITTKVNIDAFYYGGYKYGIHRILNRRNNVSIEQAILKSFDNLDTEYIDLFLIHNPWKYSWICGRFLRNSIKREESGQLEFPIFCSHILKL